MPTGPGARRRTGETVGQGSEPGRRPDGPPHRLVPTGVPRPPAPLGHRGSPAHAGRVPVDEPTVVPLSRILVVDDEPDLRFLLRRMFEAAGHEVVEAGNGADALAAVRRSPPHLVVTDVMMPVMDGVELIRRLRGDPTRRGIPIVAVSGHGHLAAQADTVVAKPFHPHILLGAVAALLARKAESP